MKRRKKSTKGAAALGCACAACRRDAPSRKFRRLRGGFMLPRHPRPACDLWRALWPDARFGHLLTGRSGLHPKQPLSHPAHLGANLRGTSSLFPYFRQLRPWSSAQATPWTSPWRSGQELPGHCISPMCFGMRGTWPWFISWLSRILTEVPLAATAAALFALHPAHVEVVAWLSEPERPGGYGLCEFVDDLLSVLCRSPNRKAWWFAGSLAAFLLASSGKQSVHSPAERFPCLRSAGGTAA